MIYFPGSKDKTRQDKIYIHDRELTARFISMIKSWPPVFDNLPKEFCSWNYPRYWSVCVAVQSFLDAGQCLCLHDEKNKLIISHIFIVTYVLDKRNAKPPSAFLSELIINRLLSSFCHSLLRLKDCWPNGQRTKVRQLKSVNPEDSLSHYDTTIFPW